MTEIYKDFTFEAAHKLTRVPTDHPCSRLHGHSYRVRVTLAGNVGDNGWVRDFADIKKVVKPILDRLDHQYLNELGGMDNPTAEKIAAHIAMRIGSALPGLCSVEVKETDTCGAIWRI